MKTKRPTGRRFKRTSLSLLLTAFALCLGNGCSSIKPPSYLGWMDAGNRTQTPTRITSFWKAYALKQEGSPPQRALGGRVMFYNDVDNQPIRVEGAVTFFIYDAKENDPDKTKPLVVYQFSPERVEKAYSKSDIGHSYSFIIPFDDLDGPEMDVLIHPRIDTLEDGVRVIAQAPSRLYLPGRPSEQPPETMNAENAAPVESADESRVEQASYESEIPQSRSMSTETIDVSPGMNQRFSSPLTDEERARIERVGRLSFPRPSEFSTRNDESDSEQDVDPQGTTRDALGSEQPQETILNMSPARDPSPETPSPMRPVAPQQPSYRH